MDRPRIFVTQPIENSALKRLEEHLDVTVHPDAAKSILKADLIAGVVNADYLFCRLGDIVDADVIAANPKLKLIVTMATAAAQIDVKEATRRKIPVAGRPVPATGFEPDSIIEETADLAWTLMMVVARKIIEGNELVRTGVFPGPQSPYILGSKVNEKTLGIVGLGKVGRAMARRARGFNMKVLYYDMHRYPEAETELGATFASLEELLKASDFVTLHPLYTLQTHHLIGKKELALMKPSAFLINTSRGPVVDQEALIEAVREKEIAGVALDVYEGEPHPELPADFVNMKNVVLTPHLGSAVTEKREVMSHTVVDIFLDFLAGKKPKTLFNPEIYG
ncbi:MAG: D-glycerate dehydrogenase [Desulfobacterales bacterium]|nr:D-glycerate dehydrogenase [Desulfobacterales bacterium]